MARKTRKHLLEISQWDTADLSWDAMIYTSGGVTHSVYVTAINDNGETVERYDRTFTGDGARFRAFNWTEEQEKRTTDPESKFMKAAA